MKTCQIILAQKFLGSFRSNYGVRARCPFFFLLLFTWFWVENLASVDVMIFNEPLLFLPSENMVTLRILHYTETDTDHELCCYYDVTMKKLVNPETNKRLILCDTRVVQSGAQLSISHRKD